MNQNTLRSARPSGRRGLKLFGASDDWEVGARSARPSGRARIETCLVKDI